MSNVVAIILGFVQGVTEFIPVSSSGHLIIARELIGANNSGGLAFDAILQMATSFALLLYFWKEVWHFVLVFFNLVSGKVIDETDKIFLYAIVIGTIPAIIFGLLLENQMDTVFRNIKLVGLTLVAGSILFWYAQKVAEKNKLQNKLLSLGRGVVIGFFQCLALVPGISRSGATISGGLITGLTQDEAVRFSFLLSLPILFGSGFKKLFEVRHEIFTSGFGLPLLLGSAVAFVTGLISINFLIKYLKTHNLNVFIWYRIALSIAIFLLF